MLHNEFVSLVLKYTPDLQQAEKLWQEIETAYNSPGRYYHNLFHLEQILAALTPLQIDIEDWDGIRFAVFYHDVVYDIKPNATNHNNEQRSADVAEKALSFIGYPQQKIQRVKQHILATERHAITHDTDTNFLIDADLSILGQSWNVYEDYVKKIRKEYDVYPVDIYNAGRKAVLKSFLQMNRLYKTDYFFNLFENPARENISRELGILT